MSRKKSTTLNQDLRVVNTTGSVVNRFDHSQFATGFLKKKLSKAPSSPDDENRYNMGKVHSSLSFLRKSSQSKIKTRNSRQEELKLSGQGITNPRQTTLKPLTKILVNADVQATFASLDDSQ